MTGLVIYNKPIIQIPNLKENISRLLLQKLLKMNVDSYSTVIYEYPGPDITRVPCEVIAEAIYESLTPYFSMITVCISHRILDLTLKTTPIVIDSHIFMDRLVSIINLLYTRL
jgi:hypothetical protein